MAFVAQGNKAKNHPRPRKGLSSITKVPVNVEVDVHVVVVVNVDGFYTSSPGVTNRIQIHGYFF